MEETALLTVRSGIIVRARYDSDFNQANLPGILS